MDINNLSKISDSQGSNSTEQVTEQFSYKCPVTGNEETLTIAGEKRAVQAAKEAFLSSLPKIKDQDEGNEVEESYARIFFDILQRFKIVQSIDSGNLQYVSEVKNKKILIDYLTQLGYRTEIFNTLKDSFNEGYLLATASQADKEVIDAVIYHDFEALKRNFNMSDCTDPFDIELISNPELV